VAGQRQRAQRRRVGHAEHQEVFLEVVNGEVQRRRRARPVVVRHDLHAGDEHDVRQAALDLGDAAQGIVERVAHRALFARQAGQRAKRRQPVLHPQAKILGEQQRTDPLAVG
jgi:hypothetical protein